MVFAHHQGHNSENLYVASFRLEFVWEKLNPL